MLTDNQIVQIHESSLRLLDNPGCRIEHDDIRTRLLKAGARDGGEAHTLRFPPEMIREYLALAPRTVRVAATDGDVADVSSMAPGRFWTGAALNYLTPDGEFRPIHSADLADWARLTDRLDGIHALVGTAIADVPPPARDFVGLRIMAENTGKHLRALSFTSAGAEAMREMASVLANGDLRKRPVLSMGFTAHGPLRWTHLALDIFLKSAGSGIPLTINGEPACGASAPVTLAGALAVGNAEVLAGIVLNQVIEPGRPVIHNLGFSHILDMKTAIAVTGGPEVCLLAASGAALARHYGLPSCSWMCTEAAIPDEQAMIETTMGALTHLQAGVSVIWGAGQLESEKTISPAKAVMDNEVIAMARRYERGVEVNPDTLAEDTVREVGIAGHFLGADHTLAHYRTEFYEPSILCRVNRDNWLAAGGRRLSEVAAERARDILTAPRAERLDAGRRAELRRIEAHYLHRIVGAPSAAAQ